MGGCIIVMQLPSSQTPCSSPNPRPKLSVPIQCLPPPRLQVLGLWYDDPARPKSALDQWHCHFGLLGAYRDAVRCPQMCGHLWSGWTTPLCVRCSWHCPRKPVGSCEWFSLGYRQAFGRIWCNIAAQVIPSFRNNWQSDERSLHFFAHRPTVTDWRFLWAGENSGMHMKCPLHNST
jgi:hypothetical protein